jgi:hypothetical protein
MFAIVLQVSNTQQQERHGERKEQEEEGDSGSERAEKQDESEDEPAHEEQAEGVKERSFGFGGELGFDVDWAGDEYDGEGDPEAAVGGEGGGAEGVAYGHFPDCGLVFYLDRDK